MLAARLVDFNLATSTPEFPMKGVGDIFGLLRLFYGASMFFNGYRRMPTPPLVAWNFILQLSALSSSLSQ
ncbi:MAG: hypothetical protein ACLTQI_05230 [Slackia sp.]